MNSASIDEILVACLEMKSHALAFAKILYRDGQGASCRGSEIKQGLVGLTSSIKASLDANLV